MTTDTSAAVMSPDEVPQSMTTHMEPAPDLARLEDALYAHDAGVLAAPLDGPR